MKVTVSCLIDREELAKAIKDLQARIASGPAVMLSLFEAQAILNLLGEMRDELAELDSQCLQ